MFPFLLCCVASLVGSAEPETLSPLQPLYSFYQDLSQRTVLVIKLADKLEYLENDPLDYSWDDPTDPNNEQYANPQGFDNQIKLKSQAKGILGLKQNVWYGASAWLRYPRNVREVSELDLMKRAARKFGGEILTTGPKVVSGNFARYKRLVDTLYREGLQVLVDGPGRYWLGICAWSNPSGRLRRDGYADMSFRVFDTLEKTWLRGKTQAFKKNMGDELEVYAVGRGKYLVYLMALDSVEQLRKKTRRRIRSYLWMFDPNVGEYREVLATQWTLGMHLYDLDGDGFYEYCATGSWKIPRGYTPTSSGLVWRDSLKMYEDIQPLPDTVW